MEVSDSTPQKGSKRCLFLMLFLILGVTIVTLILSAAALGQCSTKPDPLDGSTLSVKFVQPALGLPGFESLSWKDVTIQASGKVVRFWMFDYDVFNHWIDTILAPRVALRYNIQIVRVPLNDTKQAVEKLEAERFAGNHKSGSVDLIWINSENFHKAKTANNLYGPWTRVCPNAANFDWSALYVAYDDGTPTNGLEMPYNLAQNTWAYNPDHVWDNCTFDNITNTHCLPRTITEITQWVVANPGRFTYPPPEDFYGTTFIKNLFVTIADPTTLYGAFSAAKYEARARLIFPILKKMQPALALDNVTGVQPTNVEETYAMFGSGQTWLAMTDNALDAGRQVQKGFWPSNTKAFVPSTGTLTSTDFVAIGYNSPNVLAAVVVGNEIADIAMQFSRRLPDGLAQLQTFNVNADSMISGGWSVAFDALKDTPQTPSREHLRQGAVASVETEYSTTLEQDWKKCVRSGEATSPCA